jgi:mandelamide amidase
MPDRETVSRREFLIGASALAAVAGDGESLAGGTARSDASLLELSAVEAVALMSRGDLSAEHYAGALLARAAAEKALNAFITLDPERVLEAARAADLRRSRGAATGLLHGLPVPVKDSLNTAEYPTTAGTPALRGFRPAADAPLVAALRGAGAIVMGKTNLHELSYGWTSNNLAYGAVRNPYDRTRIPGGSSGGTAVAIAAHMAPLGVAEDTEGSIRVPAALCGVVGFRPTTGRYSTVGAVPISPLFDQAGPHARSVADIGLFDAAVTGDRRPLVTGALHGVRLAVNRSYFFGGLDPLVERVTNEALSRLREAGVELVDVELPRLAELIDLITYEVQNHDVRIELARYLTTYGAPVNFDELIAQASQDIRAVFASSVLPGGRDFVPEASYHAAVEVHLPALRREFAAAFARSGAAAFVFPATMVTAPPIGVEDELTIAGRQVPFDVAIARNIAPGSTTGLPGLVLPAGLATDGLPVALEFDGPHGADRALLGLGSALEKVLGRIPAPPG